MLVFHGDCNCFNSWSLLHHPLILVATHLGGGHLSGDDCGGHPVRIGAHIPGLQVGLHPHGQRAVGPGSVPHPRQLYTAVRLNGVLLLHRVVLLERGRPSFKLDLHGLLGGHSGGGGHLAHHPLPEPHSLQKRVLP